MERLMSRIVIDGNDCWNYPTLNEGGYGVIGMGGRGAPTRRTHRLTYESFVGTIPDGTEIDHLCRNRACCNPAHLEPVNRSTNVRRGLRKTSQSHCANGHMFSEQNTKQTKRQRVCIECSRAASREYQRRLRAAKRAQKEEVSS